MERLKVLFITAWYPTPEQPVVGIFVREHAKAVQHYDDVAVLHVAGVSDKLSGACRIERETDPGLTEGIPTYRLWFRRSPIPHTSFFFLLWGIFRASRHIVARGFRPDIVHAHVHSVGISAVLLAKILRVPLVFTEQSTVFPSKSLSKTGFWQAKIGFERASVVLPVSHSLEKAISEYGINANTRVVPNVVDTAVFTGNAGSPSHSTTHLLFVGLLDTEHKKGVPVLLKALGQLKGGQKAWHLDIVGDGPARDEYEQLVTELELKDRVTFHGMQPKQKVAEWMNRADFFVLPSVRENLPCVITEAMASGLPIVSTLADGIPEMVDADTGILVTPGDVSALSSALDEMMDTQHRYDRTAILEKSRRYSQETVGQTLHAIYQDSIRGEVISS